MLGQWKKACLMVGVLCGLCATVAPNTTAADAFVPQARIALLLPMKSQTLGEAAHAVRAGFMAAYQREKDTIAVTLFETGDAAQDVLSGYQLAAAQNDIVVGPLSRTGVAAIAQRAVVSKPTLALTALDSDAGGEPRLPPLLLVMGLSIEDEAKQVAQWASFDKGASKALVVSTRTPWQRRAAKAFSAQWKHLGYPMEAVELPAPDGYLDGKALIALKKKVAPDDPLIVFAALDAWQARQLREALGPQFPMYGTSQLNPVALADRPVAERVEEMEGARLVDMPWQLQADHPAVMAYPDLPAQPDRKRSADIERLYALGIDAFRVAREIAQGRNVFEVDGVTGKLQVRIDAIGSTFERIAQQAVYRDGAVVAENPSGPR